MGVTIFFGTRRPSMNGLPPACRKKWWGPVVLEAGAVPVPCLRDLREEVWQHPRGLDAPWGAMVLTQHVPNHPSDIAPITAVDKKRDRAPDWLRSRKGMNFVNRLQIGGR